MKNQIPQKKLEERILILIIAHGENVATSMAEAVNSLMMTDLVYGFNIPINVCHEDIFEDILNATGAIHSDNGILLMVDMGSLSNIGKKISENSGIPVRTIERVLKIYVIEAVRRILYEEEGLEDIYRDILKLQTIPYGTAQRDVKPPVIITTCKREGFMGFQWKQSVLWILPVTPGDIRIS